MRIAFVLARYGVEITGGAEKLAHGLAHEAVSHDWDVEVWTTCATSYATWANELPAGRSQVDGITIRRFEVDSWNPVRFHTLTKKFSEQVILPVQQQYEWLASGPHSSELYQHVAKFSAGFDLIIVLPYIHSISYFAAWLAGDRVLMWPCLHDEVFAYMEPFRLLLESAWAVVFNSPEEERLAFQQLQIQQGRSIVLGSGTELSVVTPRLSEVDQPYLLYVGRLVAGKNIDILYEYIRRLTDEGIEIRLVVAGDGTLKPPQHPAFDFRGLVNEEEKATLFASALAVCQPSFYESFSLVIMESWLAGRPALVWSGCDVTVGHVMRSGGGLHFAGYQSFKEAVHRLRTNSEDAARMGENGRLYVEKNYTWSHIFQRFTSALSKWELQDKIATHE